MLEAPGQHVCVSHRRYLRQSLKPGRRTDEEGPSTKRVDLQGQKVLGCREGCSQEEAAHQKSSESQRNLGEAAGMKISCRLCLLWQRLERPRHPGPEESRQGSIDVRNEPQAEGLQKR